MRPIENTTAVEADYREYAAPETIRRYERRTAGEGINHLLREEYGPIFLESALAVSGPSPMRMLEFGCGAGMALHYLTEALGERGVDVELAIGTDFVPGMVSAARAEVERYGSEFAQARMRFAVATNETIVQGIAEELGSPPDSLNGTFQLALGVNTFRYAVRHGTADEVVAQLEALLAPGGRVVMIDMNDRFPYGIKPRRPVPGKESRYPIRLRTEALPSLAEYTRPFADAGFEVLRREHFCWIPHSASGFRFRLARALTPHLDRLIGDRAMRSLVVARKP
jgi:SAM-dependent methyltransferase